MSFLAVDLNATRLRCLLGNSAADAGAPYLEGHRNELPMAVSLAGNTLQIGTPALALCRKSPHLACCDFLSYLGQSKEWTGDAYRINAAQALHLIFQHVVQHTGQAVAVVLGVPGYLDLTQRTMALQIAAAVRWPLLGAIHGGLAAALAAYADQPFIGRALVVDVDGHALTWSVVMFDEATARILLTQPFPNLGLATWKQRLIDAIADRCVRISRNDPRASAEAEQSLFNQLDRVLEAWQASSRAELIIQGPQWSQQMMLGCEEIAQTCTGLVQRAMSGFESVQTSSQQYGRMGAIVMTSAAARLPGLGSQLQMWLDATQVRAPSESTSDFGADLFGQMEQPARLHVLPPGAAVRSMHELSLRHAEGIFVGGYVEQAPVPQMQRLDQGMPRLVFNGKEIPLRGPVFTLGRHPNSDIVFDSSQFPSVSANHCEVTFDEFYLLRDRSRYGTLINDRPVQHQCALQPGDWIRLGPGGPVLRFMGQPIAPQQRAGRA